MTTRRFYKSKLYKFNLDESINLYLGIHDDCRTFKQIMPVPTLFFDGSYWSPKTFDSDYEVFPCELLEILMGIHK